MLQAGNVHSHEPEGWFITGDVGNIDHEGFLQLTDRTKDIIRSGGVGLLPDETLICTMLSCLPS